LADADAKLQSFSEFKAKNKAKLKLIAKLFGRLEKNAYLCNVRTSVLAIRVESRVG